jgi:glycosyltransferase involved in cell wall biosynthesis
LKIRLENVNLNSNSGPNSFAQKLVKELEALGHSFVTNDYDRVLCFIEDHSNLPSKNLYQRLDGIYFNTDFNYNLQNSNILKTYQKAQGVIFQSKFSEKLVTSFFGSHRNTTIIHNGADLNLIEEVRPIQNNLIDRYETIWSCASSWRPHKRLSENIRYFLEHKGRNDCLLIAGKPDYAYKDPNIFYVGELNYEKLLSLYKRSKYFIHLAWFDNCPNVVVDARACGNQIICSTAGGTQEIAGEDAVVIEEDKWDFRPIRLYSPPPLDFSKKIKNTYVSCYDMADISKKYLDFIGEKR